MNANRVHSAEDLNLSCWSLTAVPTTARQDWAQRWKRNFLPASITLHRHCGDDRRPGGQNTCKESRVSAGSDGVSYPVKTEIQSHRRVLTTFFFISFFPHSALGYDSVSEPKWVRVTRTWRKCSERTTASGHAALSPCRGGSKPTARPGKRTGRNGLMKTGTSTST